MLRALELAARGPATGANPQVGCVILSPGGEIIAEGWHRGLGTPHAEVDALSSLAPDGARGATAVVTLEPCNHHGRTGPCSEALIAAGVARVVYAVGDPNPVARGGADRLRDAGVEVIAGVEVERVEELMHPWLTAMRRGVPWVTLKWASSLDGRAAAADGTSQWITGEAARARVHLQRAAADAIMVGTGTVLADDPSLTARDTRGGLLPSQPIPVVIGDRELPATAQIFHHPQPLIAMHGHDLHAVLSGLFARGIRRVLLEGGPTLASAFIAEGLVDEYLLYLAPILLGGGNLATADLGVGTLTSARRLTIVQFERVGEDILVRARPREEG
ncbi:bifunctional diaminohydroxyphosphoribosylaminopyrimidine deaminase/5-amino-6-(5-phosphoribosylamino)uracil reductase RibD [Terrimesophilobacter mesophilus]|uniref:Riboflavin biosynthesis protein RibD n=2 Tax=Terrimesophilobacter mesophilus TaxID=433647 RepID=A0A4R8VG77_9MICO|nr:bifunctional diaminohydroxyphosphoribosylaminopyrimidine deaminase/5-amino-6-(5-phosphoribosylamino)uracil reductase RibD [Terrimesophilobacter mesophilus]